MTQISGAAKLAEPMPPDSSIPVRLRIRSEPAAGEPTPGAIEAVAADACSFERVFGLIGPSLYRFLAVRIGDSHLADDFMQQLWLQGSRQSGRIPADELEFWLRAIARNLIRTHWRKQARRPAHVPVPDPALAAKIAQRLVSEELPPQELERKEVRDQLMLAITALPASEQELIVGHYFDQMSHAQLAAKWGTSERAIEGRLYRARQTLRSQLPEPD